MAGHSKWANIKHRKAAQDVKRGKLFTKLIREITVAARVGGGEIDSNPRLRTAVDKALTANMTRDTIERAIKRGVGTGETDNYEAIRYEGYASGGVCVESMESDRDVSPLKWPAAVPCWSSWLTSGIRDQTRCIETSIVR